MKSYCKLWLATAILFGALAFVNGASCISGDGKEVCKGPCCHATATSCNTDPCDPPAM